MCNIMLIVLYPLKHSYMSHGKHWTDFRVYKTLLKESLFTYDYMCYLYPLLKAIWDGLLEYTIEQNNKNW